MAESAARKDVKLRLSVEADMTRGSRALQDLARDADKVEQSAGKAAKALTGMTAGTRTPGGSPAAGLTPAGSQTAASGRPVPVVIVGPRPLLVTGLGGAAGTDGAKHGKSKANDDLGDILSNWKTKAVAKVALIGGVASLAANLTEAFQGMENPLTTAREKVLGFAGAVPLIGSTLKKLTSDLLDMAFRLQHPEQAKALDRERILQPIRLAQREALAAGQTARIPVVREAGEAAERARALLPGNAPPAWFRQEQARAAVGGFAAVESVDPRVREALAAAQEARRAVTSAQFERSPAEWEVRNAREALAHADTKAQEAIRTANAARAAAAVAPGRDVRTREQQRDAMIEANKAQLGPVFGRVTGYAAALSERLVPQTTRQLGNALVGAGQAGTHEQALLNEQRALQEQLHAQERLQRAITTDKEKQLQIEQKINELRKLETQVMKAQLAVLDEQLNKAQTAARQFGGLDVVSQRAAREAYGRFEKFGREGVTQEEYGQLSGLGLVQDDVARRAEEAASKSEIYRDLLTRTGKKDVQTLAAERVKLKSEIDLKVEMDEVQLAKTLESTLKKVSQDLEGVILRIVQTQLKKIEIDSELGRVQRSQQ